MNAWVNQVAHEAGMEAISSDILERVLQTVGDYNYEKYSPRDVADALGAEVLSVVDFAALLSPAAAPFLERMAARARAERRRVFGNSVALFTPLYLSNYCRNQCVYCGFSAANKIRRAQLSSGEIERELQAIRATGLQDILLLTGEARSKADVGYIGEAVKLAARHFNQIGIEVYPLNTDEYAYLHQCGADYVCVFQETYDPERYLDVHPRGPKRVFAYRFHAQERALRGGMRGVAFAAFWGLPIFVKTLLPPAYMLISSNKPIRARKSRSRCRVCAPISTMRAGTPAMSTRPSCCR